MSIFDLLRAARVVSAGIWVGTGVFAAAGLFVQPTWFLGLVLFGPLFVGDLYCRRLQRRSAILRNFGTFGALRYLLESLGPELRQYWIASDTEEKPFSRRERAEVYRYAKDEAIKSAAFGTQNTPLERETIRHSMFPITENDLFPYVLTFGEERGCPNPFSIDKPFMISGMSFGALGEHAVRALSRGAKRAGIAMNTGEGGFPKHHLREGASIIFQIGTAKFGVRKADATLDEEKLREISRLEPIKMIEIKFSQGAKPGKGGLLPASKVTPEIAELRGVPVGKDILSPPRHVECDTPANTVRFIKRVQDVSELPVGIKLCLGREEEFLALVREMKHQDVFPDYIAVDGAQGGTGAAPAAFLDHVGVPLFPALDRVHRLLIDEAVRDRLKLVASGKLINASSQLKAMAHGADAVATARGFMLALGCIQALHCNTDNCPVGITTHNRRLQSGLDIEEKANRVSNYARNLEHTLRELLAATGCHAFGELTMDRIFVPWDPQTPGELPRTEGPEDRRLAGMATAGTGTRRTS